MMEFAARLLVNCQDPELAYSELRRALQFTGIEIKIADSWLKNNKPLPKNSAQRIALAWQRGKDPGAVDDRIQFQTNDPAVMAELNQMDLFARANDVRNLAYLRAGDDLEIEGHVGIMPITGEGA